MKLSFKIFFFLFFSNIVLSQENSQYTQYMYNTITVNPAYAGSRNALSIFGLYRTQWVGFEGAPVTANFSVESPLDKSSSLGITFYKDKIGNLSDTNFALTYSYRFNVSENYKLSFGVSAVGDILHVDTNLYGYNSDDLFINSNIGSKFSPNIGTGIYLNSEKTYIGLSVPSLLSSSNYDVYNSSNGQTQTINRRPHFYFIAGNVMDLNEDLKFKPSLLLKATQGAPLQVDLSANFMYLEKISAGLAYRWSAALSAMIGFQLSEQWLIGYAYDMETTKLSSYNSGSHEIFLRYEFKNKGKYVNAPRFF